MTQPIDLSTLSNKSMAQPIDLHTPGKKVVGQGKKVKKVWNDKKFFGKL
jgi:hypothetical protein